MLLFYRTDVSLEFPMYQHFCFFPVVPRFHWKVQGLFCIFCFLKVFHGLQIVTWTWSHGAVVDSLILCHWWYICLVQDVIKGYLNLLVLWFKIRGGRPRIPAPSRIYCAEGFLGWSLMCWVITRLKCVYNFHYFHGQRVLVFDVLYRSIMFLLGIVIFLMILT